MAMGRRKREQQDSWVATCDLPKSPGHPFYQKLNGVLEEAGFDTFAEKLCRPYYAKKLGRPGIPPGVYFRMLFVGYMEGLSSQRAIAWRCSDSRSLQSFLGYGPTETTPDHSSLTVIRQRLPLEVHEQVFAFVVSIANDKKLLKGASVAVDSTMIEADAAMKSIVRRDNGDDWKEYVRKLMADDGIDDPSDEDIRRYDQKRKKKVSNKDWMSPTDPDARIARMKDGRTHMAYKTEHAIDLHSDIILAAAVYHADQSDTATLAETVIKAQAQLDDAGGGLHIKDLVADKGYHSTDNLLLCDDWEIRSYIPERERRSGRTWRGKSPSHKRVTYGNRRRVKGDRGRRLSKLRSEYVERSFAHVCETGGARRSWLHGLLDVTKRYLMYTAGKNLGVLMRALFGMGKPKTLQPEGGDDSSSLWAKTAAIRVLFRAFGGHLIRCSQSAANSPQDFIARLAARKIAAAA